MFKTILNCSAFLTLLPIKTDQPLTEAEMGRFPACYPVVGLLLGLASLILANLSGWAGLKVTTTAILLVTAQIILTRGFHLDGLADTADALLSHRTLERKLEILKDSHLGTFGVLAIVLNVLLKTSLLNGPTGLLPLHVLVLYPVWGRLTASVVATLSRPATQGGGLGYNMVAFSGHRELFAASMFSLVVSLIFGAKTLFCCLVAALLGLPLVWLWKKSLGGVSGDLLGASLELGEILGLLFFIIIA
jgi:adenosylcobinamide-GDP ribazoletransferase